MQKESSSSIAGAEEDEPFPRVYYVECLVTAMTFEEKSVGFGPFREGLDEPHLQDLIDTLNRMSEEFPKGLSLTDTYENVPGFLSWFDSEFASARSLYKAHPAYKGEFEQYAETAQTAQRYGGVANHWPRGIVSVYCETPAELSQYRVLFFNEKEKQEPSQFSTT